MKIHSLGADLFHVCGRTGGRADKQDRRTDLTKLIVLSKILRMCLIVLRGLEHSQNRHS